MQELLINAGGRPRRVDDLKALQDQINLLQQSHAFGGSYLIAGCNVSAGSIASGLVFIDNRILVFDAVGPVTFPYYIFAAASVDAVSDVSALNGVQVTQVLHKATGSNALPVGSYITVSATGGRSLRDALGINVKADRTYADNADDLLRNTIRDKEQLQLLINTNFQANINSVNAKTDSKQRNLPVGTQLMIKGSLRQYFNGFGLGEADWEGWAIANGDNGTDNWASYFPVGYDVTKPPTPVDAGGTLKNYGTPGNTGYVRLGSITSAADHYKVAFYVEKIA